MKIIVFILKDKTGLYFNCDRLKNWPATYNSGAVKKEKNKYNGKTMWNPIAGENVICDLEIVECVLCETDDYDELLHHSHLLQDMD